MNNTPLPSGDLSHSNKLTMDPNDKSARLYQVWKGNNTFLLGGRLIFGPDVKSIFLTLFLILAPFFFFCALVSQELVHALPLHSGLIILVVCAVWTTYVVLLLFMISGRDPGILPRNLHPPDPDDYDGSTISSDCQSATSSIPKTRHVMVNRKAVKVKYCRTCMFYRPPRCSHCSICNNCVDRFDHHCPWLGQCIGRRNYRYFFMFVSATTILCLYVFGFCLVNITIISKTNHCGIWKATSMSPISGVLIAYTFLAAWFVGGLTVFHIYLICTNQTTYENFRYAYDRKSNPYNIGCAHNIWEVLFSKIPNSKHNFRVDVVLGSSSRSNLSSNLQRSYRSNPSENQSTGFDLEKEKRQSVNSDDIEDIRSDIVSALSRSGDHKRGDWEITLDLNRDLPTGESILHSQSQHNAHHK